MYIMFHFVHLSESKRKELTFLEKIKLQ